MNPAIELLILIILIAIAGGFVAWIASKETHNKDKKNHDN